MGRFRGGEELAESRARQRTRVGRLSDTSIDDIDFCLIQKLLPSGFAGTFPLTRQALKGGQHEAVALAVHPQAEQLAAVPDTRHVHLQVGVTNEQQVWPIRPWTTKCSIGAEWQPTKWHMHACQRNAKQRGAPPCQLRGAPTHVHHAHAGAATFVWPVLTSQSPARRGTHTSQAEQYAARAVEQSPGRL